jgi:uncharacterized small protein (DUF1192 family)
MMNQITPQNEAQQRAQLSQQIDKLTMLVQELSRRVSYLERENTRRKADVNHLANTRG